VDMLQGLVQPQQNLSSDAMSSPAALPASCHRERSAAFSQSVNQSVINPHAPAANLYMSRCCRSARALLRAGTRASPPGPARLNS
jgi:hypothetical protein